MKKQQQKKKKAASHTSGSLSAGQVRDVNSREVFKDPILCAQFLRDYTGISLLENVQPEDIEDVSEKYHAYLGITFEADTVKKIRLKHKDTENIPLYMISLIEHKSDVDYNISMQLLKYMACIWHDYGKEMEKTAGSSAADKNFKYPPILPIVYYEGANEWTAGLHLKDRIMLSDVFGEYLPDFTYRLVRLHDYTNRELLNKGDEMSLLMTLNKAQTPGDISTLWENIQKDDINKIILNTPAPTLEIIVSVAWNLLMKLNVPIDEAKEYTKKIKERQMGYLFENMEKMDIQKERQKTEQQRKRADMQQHRADMQQQRADMQQQRADEQQQRAEKAEKELEEKNEQGIRTIISLCRKLQATKETAVTQVMENSALSNVEARGKVDLYWEEN